MLIVFCNYTVYPAKSEYITHGAFHEYDGTLISDQVSVIIIELSKLEGLLSKPVQSLTPLDAWSIFFKYAAEPEHRELLNRIISEREAIAVATNVLLDISQDEDQRASYLTRRKNETDRVSERLTILHKRELEIARAMKDNKLSFDTILEVTEISEKELEDL